ncbi:MAG: cell division protein FtsH [Candidatus Zambryskibacteria bacterium RIFCSPLOWO2_02_FULL_39_26]|uniref:ATP-dependent zinc metalloprotease FtsH n=1 Tax=Candidatus Zambryskibacteria bacterium RIFCSPLOWO2_12_FULL_39_23 TaxID=1802776 RepID=A0A1G2USS6_9BACT|nr:MAG: cell division protein FtsH [Candidatus Zambryskibacteria bacterium RIFCSPHIGHO2_02_39_10]OHA99619.1 MAG: cell division protein FtsH [Candidatus Zambryskibacteria bacterium RIFCSPHIGHO2_12_FULL_39_47]OHB10131.1 MAG: cell division protein FtsH [Candidatus Zambryskibacteria bacterium RIFCSPLOWO2_02_FULL_39_26]OHB12445.1 MAG: cell division protein FtsH [Candidatus Zambryskibacteria bacterium RIFCSPLOWO2_12_FULL_39_23]
MRKGGGPSNKPSKNGSIVSYIISTLLIFIIISTLYSFISDSFGKKLEQIPISELATDIKSGLVKVIVVKGDTLDIEYKAGEKKTSKKEGEEALIQTLVNYSVPKDQLAQIKIEIKNESGLGYWLLNLSPIIFPILFIAVFIWFITRQVKGAGMQALTFGQSKARMIDPNDKNQRVTFKDVAGCKEAKEELLEIVDFLRNPKKFLDIGARIPKGILLMGAPGTGKTLLARAVAGEASVAFFSISGSEFVEMFVGVGASRVRDLFLMAKKNSPSIIFVDEIDAVGRVRGIGAGGGNDEREQTLNQILVEMDGFEPNEKVIVMAATNRPDVLDPALLRPGRFDRRVTLDLPDRKDREEILQVHSTKKPFAEDVNLVVIAERTPGFSGADLYSLMNEGAILAAREDRTKVSQFDLIRSIEKVMLGPERKSHILSKKEKEITAYHEAGHAVLASMLPYADPVHKISIIARGRALGYVFKLPLEDNKLQSKKEFLDDIAVSLGGYVTEKMLFGDLTTGPSNDLQVSTALARDMVTKYGMSDMVGPVALEGQGGKILYGRGVEEKEYSEKVGADIDAEVSRIMKEAHEKAEKIITENKPLLEAIAKRLIETETIERVEFENILIANGITPKKKLDIEHQT